MASRSFSRRRFTGEIIHAFTVAVISERAGMARKPGLLLLRQQSGGDCKTVEEVVRDVQEHFIQTPKTPYLLEIATSYYLFEQGEKSIELKTADNSQNYWHF